MDVDLESLSDPWYIQLVGYVLKYGDMKVEPMLQQNFILTFEWIVFNIIH